MALEPRKGKLYYYSKRREGGRVVSVYEGSGTVAILEDERRKRARARQEKAQEKERIKRMSMAEIDAELDGFCRIVDTLLAGELIASGHYKHKGQWRRKGYVSKAK
jgi:hypothetical protein